MQFLVFAFLALLAVGFIGALIVGFTLKLVGLLLMALLVVGAVRFVIGKIRGARRTLKLDRPLDAVRLPR